MAKTTIDAGYVTIGAVDYTAQIRSASLELTSDVPEVTNFDSAGWREFIAGLKSGSFSVDFVKDSDLSGLDAAIWTAFSAGTALAVAIRRDTGAISTSNPEYQFNVLVNSWMPVTGAVGDVFSSSHSWQVTGAVVRDTTP